jgi:hypothetical protein
VEGVHFVAGPWFTVRENGADFQPLGEVWMSNGSKDEVGRVEYKVRLGPPTEAPEHLEGPDDLVAPLALAAEGM